LTTLQFLGKKQKEPIVGADENSWKKTYKSEKYGFQMKYETGLTL